MYTDHDRDDRRTASPTDPDAWVRQNADRIRDLLRRTPNLGHLADRLDAALAEPDGLGLAAPTPPGKRVRSTLAPYADDLASARDAAEDAGDREGADALAVLTALAEGEDVPEDAAHRVIERAK